jgi:selenocysteine lyase/cysteine desulfurase
VGDFSTISHWIREQEIGRGSHIRTPFGRRLVCYADLTATGRHLRAVEDWVGRTQGYYANTHTEVSSTGRLMTRLRESARETIRRSVNAAAEDEVVFAGSGATAAVNKLVGLLGLRLSEPLEREHALSDHIPRDARPVVIVGPYEHHSNELPWLESIAEVHEIGTDAAGVIDLAQLSAELDKYRERPLKIGSFSAASNVTGILTDVHAIARVLHQAGALAVFDYAAAGPYVPIDMHPEDEDARIDAIVLSPHKFIGGPGSSGLLVANRKMFRTRVPDSPGGGTVDYVVGSRREDVDYMRRLDHREEGGTPAIAGDIRAGMAFEIKERIGPAAILEHEISIAEQAAERLSRHPKIRVLGPRGVPRLAIVPILIEGLHHELSSALLDHLFGIQNRAGCSCAGPYGHRLLGIDLSTSGRFRKLVGQGINGIKPGWARLSLPYYASNEDLEFILSATEFVASHGEVFIPLYEFGWRRAVWRPIDLPDATEPAFDLSFEALRAAASNGGVEKPGAGIAESELQAERTRYFDEAGEWVTRLRDRWVASPPVWNPPTGHAELDDLTWFRYVHSDTVDPPVPD